MQDFISFLTDIREGDAIEQARVMLTELSAAVADTGKEGTLTLTIELEPVKGSAGRAVSVSDTITSKVPKRDQEKTLLFRGEGGRFSRRDPRQPELPSSMRDVSRAPEPREEAASG